MSEIRSMTGYARVKVPFAGGAVTVSLKTVNHKGLDLHFHLPSELDPVEAELRAAIKAKLRRGHVDIRAQIERDSPAGEVAINQTLLGQYVGALKAAAKLHEVNSEPDLAALLRLPGVLGEDAAAEPTDACPAAQEAMERALQELDAFRLREGAELGRIMREHHTQLQRRAEELRTERTNVLPLLHERVKQRLAELLGEALEPQRLAQEAAVLADKSDIAEELGRLQIHADQLAALLGAGGEIGKKLDFLMQEMNREANTILAKTAGLGTLGLTITAAGLATKAEVEKIREQALNLE